MFDLAQTAVKRSAEHAVQQYLSKEVWPKRDDVDNMPEHKESGNGPGDKQHHYDRFVENVQEIEPGETVTGVLLLEPSLRAPGYRSGINCARPLPESLLIKNPEAN